MNRFFFGVVFWCFFLACSSSIQDPSKGQCKKNFCVKVETDQGKGLINVVGVNLNNKNEGLELEAFCRSTKRLIPMSAHLGSFPPTKIKLPLMKQGNYWVYSTQDLTKGCLLYITVKSTGPEESFQFSANH